VNAEPAPSSPPNSTARSRRAWTVLVSTVAIALFLDLISKYLAFARLADQPVRFTREDVLALPSSQINALIPAHSPTVVVPHLLELKLVLNPGAVFGFGAGGRWFFAAFTVLAISFALWMFARWTTPRQTLTHVSIGLIIAGGLGNLYDRLVYACVRDFLHPLYSLHFPGAGGRPVWPYVSNVADAFLLVGIAFLMLHLWRSAEPPAPKPQNDA
jgi:signal peptidase II